MEQRHKESVGVRIRRLRNEMSMAQRSLANEAHITQTQMWRIESDKQEPKLFTAMSICRVLKVSMDYMCCLTDERP